MAVLTVKEMLGLAFFVSISIFLFALALFSYVQYVISETVLQKRRTYRSFVQAPYGEAQR